MASMQYDVLASAVRTTTGQMQDQGSNNLGRCRIKAIYGLSGTTAGSVAFKDGGSGGTALITVDTPAAANQGTFWLLLPGEGILVETNLHATITNTASVMVIYG